MGVSVCVWVCVGVCVCVCVCVFVCMRMTHNYSAYPTYDILYVCTCTYVMCSTL